MSTFRKYYLVLFLLIAGFVSGCLTKSTPPGPNSVGGMVEGAVYSYYYWAEGLGILVWHDLSFGTAGCSESASTDDELVRLECTAEAQDGRSLHWAIHTMDGITAEMWINGQEVDLSQGNMFLISVDVDEIDIRQEEPSA
jgi:hypothetical protein